jgi:FKBP-type peptidyl-prolyl cis-trans isomerase
MSAMKIPCLVFVCGCLLLVGCNSKADKPSDTAAKQPVKPVAAANPKVKTTDVVVGKGKTTAQSGDTVWMAYTGVLKDGTQFDSNEVKDKDPYAFTIDQAPTTIKGWHDGVKGMKVGGTRRMEIPSSLAYGATGDERIPPNSDLVFTVRMLGLVKAGEDNVIDLEDVKKGTGQGPVKVGDTVVIQYVGSLLNGRVFEDSHQTKEPYRFRVGAAQTLSCIDKGVRGMRVGGVRRILAPPATAYAGKMNSKVPFNSEVTFLVELVSISR